MKKLLLILVLVVFSNSSIAAEKDYTMCSITGYLVGNEEKFVAGIATRIIMETGVLETERGTLKLDPICDALMEKGIRIGKADLKRGTYNHKNMDEMRLGVDASIFKDKVYDVTISGMEK